MNCDKNELKINLENLNEQEREQLVALIEKSQAEPAKYESSLLFEPKKGQKHYLSQLLCSDYVYWCNNKYDLHRLETGTIFPTIEAKQVHVDYLKARTKVLKYMRTRERDTGWVADWSGESQQKHYLFGKGRKIYRGYNYELPKTEKSFYTSEEIAREILDSKELTDAMLTVLNYFQ